MKRTMLFVLVLIGSISSIKAMENTLALPGSGENGTPYPAKKHTIFDQIREFNEFNKKRGYAFMREEWILLVILMIYRNGKNFLN